MTNDQNYQKEHINYHEIVWHVAVYIRLSKEDGNDISESVINQKKKIQDFINDGNENFVIFDFYIDDGLSGTDDTREEFQRMIYDIERKKVNCIITKDLSRTFRNYADQGHYLEYYFVLHNIRFISVELPALDSYLHPETYNSFMVPMQGVYNDNHCRETSLKIRGVFKTKRQRGEFIGAFAPFGYLKDPDNKNHLIIDEEASIIVKDIFRCFLEGMSMRGIAMKLNDLGIPNPTMYKKNKGSKYHHTLHEKNDGYWTSTTVATILKNEMYTGTMVQGRNRVLSYKVHKQIRPPKEEWFVVKDMHEPIISMDEYENIQNILSKNIRTVATKRHVFLFSGLVYCIDCKKAMHRSSGRGKVYYVCRTNKEKSKKLCSPHSIREDRLEKAVLNAIQLEISKIEDIEKLISEIEIEPYIDNKKEQLKKMVAQYKKDKIKLSAKLDQFYDDWKNEDISREQFQRMRQQTEEQKEQKDISIKNLEIEIESLNHNLNKENTYIQTFKQYKNITKLNRDILVTLIDAIHVHSDGAITIQYLFQDNMKHIIEMVKFREELFFSKF